MPRYENQESQVPLELPSSQDPQILQLISRSLALFQVDRARWNSTNLHALFQSYGEVEELVSISERNLNGHSSFVVVFTNSDGASNALSALKEDSEIGFKIEYFDFNSESNQEKEDKLEVTSHYGEISFEEDLTRSLELDEADFFEDDENFMVQSLIDEFNDSIDSIAETEISEEASEEDQKEDFLLGSETESQLPSEGPFRHFRSWTQDRLFGSTSSVQTGPRSKAPFSGLTLEGNPFTTHSEANIRINNGQRAPLSRRKLRFLDHQSRASQWSSGSYQQTTPYGKISDYVEVNDYKKPVYSPYEHQGYNTRIFQFGRPEIATWHQF